MEGVCPLPEAPLHLCGMDFPEEWVVTGITAPLGLPFFTALIGGCRDCVVDRAAFSQAEKVTSCLRPTTSFLFAQIPACCG